MSIKKSILAAILISFGVAVNLKIGAPLGRFLFAFGLMGVCVLRAELYTGKAGYVSEVGINNLIYILTVNLIAAAICGLLLKQAMPEIIPVASTIVEGWMNTTLGTYFIKSIFCGMIMFIAVDMYNKGNIFGILFGIPLFIICGFQHCIANIIIGCIAIPDINFSVPIIISIVGNLVGGIIIRELSK